MTPDVPDEERQLSLFEHPSLYEGADIEFKSGKGGVPKDLWETYSAFANSNGGTIFLGIAERGTGLDIHGLKDVDKARSDVFNVANNRNKVSVTLLRDPNVQPVDLDGVTVLRIDVPRADRKQRPVYLNNDPLGHTYRRDHSGDYRCTQEEVGRMFADQADEPADSRILDGFDLSDIDTASLQQYRNRMSSSRADHPWLLEDDLGLLTKLGGWRKDRTSGQAGLTVAGLVMFGKDAAIRDAAAIPGHHLDYRERQSDDPAERWSDRITVDGTWESNLFQFYNRVLPRMVSTVKAPFQMSEDLYRFDDTSVSVALREGVVNALIHADYSGQGGIVFDRYGDRIELSNPGTLLLSYEQILKGGISECRNKSLQLMFQMMGAGDKAGSGIDRIRAGWDAARLRDPRLSESQRPDRVTLVLPMVSAFPESSVVELQERLGVTFGDLEADDVQILLIAQDEGEVTNARLQSVLAAHRTDLTKTLQKLVRDGWLVRSGFGRGTRYELPKEPLDSTDEGSSDGSFEGSSDGSFEGSSNRTFPPSTNLGQLRELVEAELSDRMSEADLRALVLRLLQQTEWLTSGELADLLDRNVKNLQPRVLAPMVDEGLLVRKYESLRHPRQAYGLKLPRAES